MFDLRLASLNDELSRVVDYVKTWNTQVSDGGTTEHKDVQEKYQAHAFRHQQALLRRLDSTVLPPLVKKSPSQASSALVDWVPSSTPTAGNPVRKVDLRPREYPIRNQLIFTAASDLVGQTPEATSRAYRAWNRRREILFQQQYAEPSNVQARAARLKNVASQVGTYEFVTSDYQRLS